MSVTSRLAPAPLAFTALAVVLCWALPATPAGAVDSFSLLRPAARSTIEGPFVVEVLVDASEGELIEDVEARLEGPTNRLYSLDPAEAADIEGRQRWILEIDPLAGDVIGNGQYDLSVRPIPATSDPPPARTRQISVAVKVEQDLVAAPTGEDPLTVSLTWEPVDLPDFLAYRIQRRPDADDGRWQTVHETDDINARDTSDTVEQAGAYRYRLVVVRGDGADGEVRGYSDPRGVRADPANPGTFDPPREPDPTETPEPTPTATSTAPPTPVPTASDVAQAPGSAETQTATTPTQPPVQAAQVPPPPPPPPRPSVVPLDDGVFQPQLPIEETATELALEETETAVVPGEVRQGGTLAVLTEDPVDRGLVVAGASGLLLIVIAAHVRRFLAGGRRL